MRLRGEREQLIGYARRLETDGLALGTAGNLSVRVGDLVAITPSCIPYGQLEPASICIVGLDGERLEGPFPPSSELPMHLEIYRATGTRAVVHTHSPFATAVATTLDELPAIHYLSAELGGCVRAAGYATFGSEELASTTAEALAGKTAVLLQCHGAVTIGEDLASAYGRSLLLEWLAALYCRGRSIGMPMTLPDEEIQHVADRLRQARRGDQSWQEGRGVEGGAVRT